MPIGAKGYLGLGTALGTAGGLATTATNGKDDKSYISSGLAGAFEGASLTALPAIAELAADKVQDKAALGQLKKTAEVLGNRSMFKNSAIYGAKGAVFGGAIGYMSGDDSTHIAIGAGISAATWAGYGALMSHSSPLSVGTLTRAINKL